MVLCVLRVMLVCSFFLTICPIQPFSLIGCPIKWVSSHEMACYTSLQDIQWSSSVSSSLCCAQGKRQHAAVGGLQASVG